MISAFRFLSCALVLVSAAATAATGSNAAAPGTAPAPLFVLNSLDNSVSVIDVSTWKETRRIATGKTPSHLWIDSKSSTVYSTMQDSDELIALDLKTQLIKWRIKTGPMPADLYGTADDKRILVALTGSDAVEVYDVSGPAPVRSKVIRTGKGAHAFRALGDGRHALVSNRVANTISKIDLQSLDVVGNFDVPGGPDCMDVSRDGKQLFVTSRWAGKLSVLDLSSGKMVRQIKVGKSPHGVWTLDHAPR